MKKITPTDVPEDLIQEFATALAVDNASATDMIVYLGNRMNEVVSDFDAERFFAQLQRDTALGHLDWLAPRNLTPR
jgi:hypothetical protein